MNIENVTKNIDTTMCLQKCIYSYCRQYVPPIKCSNGVYLYRTSTSMDSLPFEAAIFENYTQNNYRVKVNVIGKGQKSFCFYKDEIATENETSTIKELLVNSVAVFTVLKYTLSSILSLKYFFAPLKIISLNNPTSLKAPKIFNEPPKLQSESSNNYSNQFAITNQNMNNVQNAQYLQNNYNYNEQNIPYQQNMLINNQNIQINQQFPPITNVQNNQQFKPYQQIIQSNRQFIPKKNTNININNQYVQRINIPNNYFNNQNNILFNQQIKPNNHNMKIHSRHLSNQSPRKIGNPVFRTKGQIINQDGTLVQYSMINGSNFVIGLENRSNIKVKLILFLEGLIISNTGRNYAIFYSNPKERKIFNAKILNNYNGQIYFEFQYA